MQVTASSYAKRATNPLFRADHFEFLSAIQNAQPDLYVPARVRRIELWSVLAQMAAPRRPLYISWTFTKTNLAINIALKTY